MMSIKKKRLIKNPGPATQRTKDKSQNRMQLIRLKCQQCSVYRSKYPRCQTATVTPSSNMPGGNVEKDWIR